MALTDWNELTERTLAELREAPEHFRPTNFWGPGLEALLRDMREEGLENFKSWPTARVWFHPVYSAGFTKESIQELTDSIGATNPLVRGEALWRTLSGRQEALRDFDVACAMWDQENWPFDITGRGESRRGNPPEIHRLVRADPKIGYGRAHLNYLLVLAALSRHVKKRQRSFLEIGGGFGALGEVVLSRDRRARYVNLDIPPLCTVSSYYLSERFPGLFETYQGELAEPGPISVERNAVLPNYRIDDLTDDFEVFVNTYSFQEMEPDVVERYVDAVCKRGIKWAVSLNSREGKPKAAAAGEWGALDPVTSDAIVGMFEARGFSLVGSYDEPLVRSAGRVVVLKRDGIDEVPAAPVEAPRGLAQRVRNRLPG